MRRRLITVRRRTRRPFAAAHVQACALPDAKAARAWRRRPSDHRLGCAVPNGKPAPWCRSASTTMPSRRLSIAAGIEALGPSPIPNPSGLPILPPPTRSLRALPKKKLTGCDLLHIQVGLAALNVRNGRENPPIAARSAGRHRNRLRADRHWRRRGLDRLGLSRVDLTVAEASAVHGMSAFARR